MKITILGNNSALPAHNRYPTAQVIEIGQHYFLMDCGEGAQMRMQFYGLKASRIKHIFISHIHGDHYLGLVGLISSMSLLGREKALYIYCPLEIKVIVDMQINWPLGFELHFMIMEPNTRKVLIETDTYAVRCFPVYHSMPTHGFVFTEKKRKRKLLPEKLKEFEIPVYFYNRLTEGEDYQAKNGDWIKNEWVTTSGQPPKNYVFAADTIYTPSICADFMHADILYHESTYLEEHHVKAADRFHSTAKQAALIAKQANVNKLLLGHFSSKYKELHSFLQEASEVFDNVEIAEEGKTFEL